MNNAPMGQPRNEVLGPGLILGNYGESDEFTFGATKGGCEFSDNVEFNKREADGDYGTVKGAVVLSKMEAKLKINSLRWDAQAVSYFAGMQAQAIAAGKVSLYRTDNISYPLKNIAFVGQNRGENDVVIVLDNPLLLSPFSFSTARAEEIVNELEFEATYDPETFIPTDATTWPCHVIFEASTLTFTVNDSMASPIEGAAVKLSDGQMATTDASGQASFTVTKGKVKYTISKTSYTTGSAWLTIDEDTEAATVELVSV